MTTVKVEYGKAALFTLDSLEFGVLDTNLLGVGEVLVDVSDRVVSLSVSRGRQDALEPVRSGQASVTLRNFDGVLDPLNTASPLYPGVEQSRRARGLAIRRHRFGAADDRPPVGGGTQSSSPRRARFIHAPLSPPAPPPSSAPPPNSAPT